MARAARLLEFSGVFAGAISTPRKGSQELDFCVSLDLVDSLAQAGVAGTLLLGAPGEFLHYNLEDRQRLVYLANKRSRIPLLAGVTHSTFAGAAELAGEAIGGGADALVVMPPYFYRYGPEEIETFYLEFAEEVGRTLPILIDHEPRFTSPIDVNTVSRLLDSGRFAGVIDGSGDPNYFEQLLALKEQKEFALLCGSDSLACQALGQGADALVSNAACAIPEVVVGLHRAICNRDAAKAEKLNGLLQEFLRAGDPFPVPVPIRRAVELRGWGAGPLAMPLSPKTKTALLEFDRWFKAWLPGAKAASA